MILESFDNNILFKFYYYQQPYVYKEFLPHLQVPLTAHVWLVLKEEDMYHYFDVNYFVETSDGEPQRYSSKPNTNEYLTSNHYYMGSKTQKLQLVIRRLTKEIKLSPNMLIYKITLELIEKLMEENEETNLALCMQKFILVLGGAYKDGTSTTTISPLDNLDEKEIQLAFRVFKYLMEQSCSNYYLLREVKSDLLDHLKLKHPQFEEHFLEIGSTFFISGGQKKYFMKRLLV